MVRWLALVAVCSVVTAACSGSSGDDSDDSSTPAVEDDSTEADATDDGADDDSSDGAGSAGTEAGGGETDRAEIIGLPDTAVGRSAGRLLAAVLDGSVTQEQAAEALDESFPAQIDPEAFVRESAQIPPLLSRSPVVIDVLIDTEFTVALTLLNPTDGSEWAFAANVTVTEPHRLRQFFVSPVPESESDDSLADLEAATEAWRALAPEADIAVIELGPDPPPSSACPTGGDALAIGSAFKFYVLGAVARAVDRGDVAWDNDLTLVDEHYSLPSGQLQLEPPGTTLTVAQAAELMMAISDNTATDHLLGLVGRDSVEAEQEAMGHQRPELNQPFYTTRELFQLKLGDPIRLGLVAAGDEAERRRLLDDLAGEPLPEVAPDAFTEPTEIGVEWFASVGDLCRAIVDLDARGGDHPAVVDAIGSGGALPIDRAVWSDAAFKGGSEPGVLSGTWLLGNVDGRRFVVSAIANDPTTGIDTNRAFAILARVIELLAQ